MLKRRLGASSPGTWQLYDRRLWELCCGEQRILEKYVVDAVQFKARVQDCALGFSDQVPWWGLVAQSKQLYGEHEYGKKSKSALAEQLSQKRGHDNEEASKFRITVELRQVIFNYFHAEKDPVGDLAPSLVVVGGVHARLDNISLAGTWVQTEDFVVGNVAVHRRKGRSAGNIMKPWRDLREKSPDLFEGVSLMQQPAAVVDSIIMSWVLEQQGNQYPCSMWMRDLSGGGGSSVQPPSR